MTPYLICPVKSQNSRSFEFRLFNVDTACEPNSVFTLKEIQVRYHYAQCAVSSRSNIQCLIDFGISNFRLPVPGPRLRNQRNLQRHRPFRRISRVGLQTSLQAEGKIYTKWGPVALEKYRVGHLLADLGWVDLDLESSQAGGPLL